MSLKPLISIIGTTGVGKSRLAIELALALSSHSREHILHRAKVINADAMQAYSGADIITNKVPESERRGVEHLLMGFKEPGEQYVVGQWVNDAVREIDELHRRRGIPIVVGGTAYWMQHLLFPNRLASFEDPLDSGEHDRPAQPPSPALQKAISSLPNPLLDLFLNLPDKADAGQAFSLHALLSILDPPVASRWHWNDTRKVLRSLEIIKEKGLPVSEVIAQQQAQSADTPRYRTLILWLFSEPDILHPRLDARIDEMIQQGLLDDVRTLNRIALSHPSSSQVEPPPVDLTTGIFQSIGYKEFSDYVSSSEPSPAIFEKSLARTKLSTRQYAKRQVQWIRNKLLPAVQVADKSGSNTPVFLLNVVDLEKWDLEVRDVAVQIAQDFLDEKELPDPRSLSQTAKTMLEVKREPPDPTATLVARRKIICDVCTTDPEQPMMLEEGPEWQRHERSRHHRRRRRGRDPPDEDRANAKTAARAMRKAGLEFPDDVNLDFATANSHLFGA